MEDDLNFDFENALDAPTTTQQVRSHDHTGSSCLVQSQLHQEVVSIPQNGLQVAPDLPPGAPMGQSIGNYKKNYRQVRYCVTFALDMQHAFLTLCTDNSSLLQTVCTYWLKGLCMKGDTCGFLHEFNAERMPVCRSLLKYGVCKEPDCPYKHSLQDIKVCMSLRLFQVEQCPHQLVMLLACCCVYVPLSH